MKITYKEFDKMFSFCLNNKILQFFATEDIGNKVIDPDLLLRYVERDDQYFSSGGEELFSFLIKTNNIKISLNGMNLWVSEALYEQFFEFLEEEGVFEDVVLEITVDKIKEFIKEEKLDKEYVASHIVDESYRDTRDKLINYLRLDLCDIFYNDKIIEKISKFKMDRFCEAIYQIITMNTNELRKPISRKGIGK